MSDQPWDCGLSANQCTWRTTSSGNCFLPLQFANTNPRFTISSALPNKNFCAKRERRFDGLKRVCSKAFDSTFDIFIPFTIAVAWYGQMPWNKCQLIIPSMKCLQNHNRWLSPRCWCQHKALLKSFSAKRFWFSWQETNLYKTMHLLRKPAYYWQIPVKMAFQLLSLNSIQYYIDLDCLLVCLFCVQRGLFPTAGSQSILEDRNVILFTPRCNLIAFLVLISLTALDIHMQPQCNSAHFSPCSQIMFQYVTVSSYSLFLDAIASPCS